MAIDEGGKPVLLALRLQVVGRKLRAIEGMRAQRIPTLSGITYRVVAVDEETGLVLLRLDFGPGSVFGPGDRWLHAWEAFKVYGGKIHAAEAFMRAMPPNTPSGW